MSCLGTHNFSFSLVACLPPPEITNGSHLETDNGNRPFPGTTVKYVCNEGFLAHGENSENLETVCKEDRSYTLQAEQLATCARIGKLFLET